MANLQKSNPQELYDAIASVTNATKEQVDAFAKEMGLSVAEIASSDPQQALLIEWMAEQKSRAIAPAAPNKPAKGKGRGKKGQQAANIEQTEYEAPKNGLQAWHQDTEQKLDVIHEEIDTHLSQVEEAEAGQIVNRFGQVIPNILGIVNEELGRSHGDIDTFRQSFRSAIGSTGASR